MRIAPVQQQTYNNQSFQGLKNPFKFKGIQASVNNVQVTKLNNFGEFSFWQKVKEAWRLVNILQ